MKANRSSHNRHIPYKFRHTKQYRPSYCIYCGKQLEDGDWVIQKGINRRGKNLHLGAKLRGHITHTNHVITAKGEPIFSKRYLNELS